jgi:hypothetical protein
MKMAKLRNTEHSSAASMENMVADDTYRKLTCQLSSRRCTMMMGTEKYPCTNNEMV